MKLFYYDIVYEYREYCRCLYILVMDNSFGIFNINLYFYLICVFFFGRIWYRRCYM